MKYVPVILAVIGYAAAVAWCAAWLFFFPTLGLLWLLGWLA